MSERLKFVPAVETVDKEVIEARFEEYQRCFASLVEKTRSGGIDEAKAGAVLAKAYLRMRESIPDDPKKVVKLHQLLDQVEARHGVSTRHLRAGFMAEYASGRLLQQTGYNVEYPETDEDLFRSTDWFVRVGKVSFAVQSKSLTITEPIEERPIPVLSPIASIDQLNQFVGYISSLCVESVMFDVIGFDHTSRKTQVLSTRDVLESKEVAISAIPKPELFHDGGKTHLDELCRSAIKLFKTYAFEQGTIPIMCVMGSFDSPNSDINIESGLPSKEAVAEAKQNWQKIPFFRQKAA
jgi:hypothetical protein